MEAFPAGLIEIVLGLIVVYLTLENIKFNKNMIFILQIVGKVFIIKKKFGIFNKGEDIFFPVNNCYLGGMINGKYYYQPKQVRAGQGGVSQAG